jgi:hypothetical protein
MDRLTNLQLRVLAAVELLGRIRVDEQGRPDRTSLAMLVERTGEDARTLEIVIDSLHAECALVEQVLDFDGIEPLRWWAVHPQLHG